MLYISFPQNQSENSFIIDHSNKIQDLFFKGFKKKKNQIIFLCDKDHYTHPCLTF